MTLKNIPRLPGIWSNPRSALATHVMDSYGNYTTFMRDLYVNICILCARNLKEQIPFLNFRFASMQNYTSTYYQNNKRKSLEAKSGL